MSAKLKKITLSVSSKYKLPGLYESEDVTVIEQALSVGALLTASLPSTLASINDSTVAELLKQKDAEAEEKERLLTEELHKIRSTMLEAQKQITKMEKEFERDLREERTSLKREAGEAQQRAVQDAKEVAVQHLQKELAILREQNGVLEARRTHLERDRSTDLERERTSIKEAMNVALATKQEQLLKTEEMLRTLSEEYKSLNDYLRRKIRPTSSQEKGADYETLFRESLVKAYGAIPKFSIHSGSRSSTGHEADFITTFYNTSILWEVKDYSYKVPTNQIEKFLRDVRENKQVSIAVMISRTTDILGKTPTGDRHFEFEEGVLYVYLSRFEFLGDSLDLLHSLRPMFEVWKELGRDIASLTQEALLRDLQRCVEEAQKRRTEWRTHKARLSEAISWMSDSVESAEANVQSLLRRMKGTDDPAVPEGLFRPLEDERSRETASAILAVTTLSSTHELQINELAKAVAVHLSISPSTATDRIKAILLEIHAPKGKPHTTKGFILQNSI